MSAALQYASNHGAAEVPEKSIKDKSISVFLMSIFASFLLFPPTGIIASILGCLAYLRASKGDNLAAHRFFKIANIFLIITTLIGLLIYAGFTFIFILAAYKRASPYIKN